MTRRQLPSDPGPPSAPWRPVPERPKSQKTHHAETSSNSLSTYEGRMAEYARIIESAERAIRRLAA
jgi:hypothetical protein